MTEIRKIKLPVIMDFFNLKKDPFEACSNVFYV